MTVVLAPQDTSPTIETVGVRYIHDVTGVSVSTVRGWVRNGDTPTPAAVKPAYRWPKHVIDRWLKATYENIEVGMATKVCNRCRRELPLSEFYRMKAAPDGHQYTCKTCLEEVRDARRDKARARQREYAAEERRELQWYRKHYPQEGKPWNE